MAKPKHDDHLLHLDRRIKAIIAAMTKSSIPPKRRTKLSGKTSPNSFNQNLKGVPGGGRFGWSWAVLQKMADAPETGCKLATPAQEVKLEKSPDNSFTTKGNYIV